MHFGRLSLVCPAHNEEGNVADLLREWHAALRQAGAAFELILVDDGSTDDTAGEVRRLQRELNELRLLCRPRRGGQSAALASGLAQARGDVIVTCDADLQNDPADLPHMLNTLARCDLVCGWRRDRRDTWLRRLVSGAANRIMRSLFRAALHDTGCGLRVFRREVSGRILRFDGMHRFFAVIAIMEGFSVIEVPVHHRPRLRGASKYGLFDRLFRTIRDLAGLHWYRARRISGAELTVVEHHSDRRLPEYGATGEDPQRPYTIPIRPSLESSPIPERKIA